MKVAILALLTVCVLVPASPAGQRKKKEPHEAGHSNSGKGVNFYSIERELALGKELAGDVERQSQLLSDRVVTEYVNRVGQNLARNSDAKVPFNIKVIESTETNAFALPGGFMFVNTGLILTAGGEAELAGVMAHEIAHVAARHSTKQATRGEIVNYATIPLIFIGGWGGYAIRQAATLAIPLGFLQFSRAMEREADHLGLEYLYRAGYDPTAFVAFFERFESLEKRKPGTMAMLFSTHPMTSSRITRAQREIQDEMPPMTQYVVDTSEFQQVKHRLFALENVRNGKNENAKIPVLKRRHPDKIDEGEPSDTSEARRPTLKRRD